MANVFVHYNGFGFYVDEKLVEEYGIDVVLVSEDSYGYTYFVSVGGQGAYINTDHEITEDDISVS
ncbi:hypothetical protein [Nitrosophilus labii]|uniref:hypothetical protein n=1 Tax=Nitrosophilus labii TaxID=2706014 RepID=UPI0016569F13|nr:hypothetical protein [Nitrosophilus labii]